MILFFCNEAAFTKAMMGDVGTSEWRILPAL